MRRAAWLLGLALAAAAHAGEPAAFAGLFKSGARISLR